MLSRCIFSQGHVTTPLQLCAAFRLDSARPLPTSLPSWVLKGSCRHESSWEQVPAPHDPISMTRPLLQGSQNIPNRASVFGYGMKTRLVLVFNCHDAVASLSPPLFLIFFFFYFEVSDHYEEWARCLEDSATVRLARQLPYDQLQDELGGWMLPGRCCSLSVTHLQVCLLVSPLLLPRLVPG